MNTKNKVKMQLVGLDGNAFAVLGAFQREARRQGWTPEAIKKVQDKAMSGDYDNLLSTIMDNVEDPSDENEQQRRDEKHGLYGGREDVAN